MPAHQQWGWATQPARGGPGKLGSEDGAVGRGLDGAKCARPAVAEIQDTVTRWIWLECPPIPWLVNACAVVQHLGLITRNMARAGWDSDEG